jgi:hypothetical protein
MLYVRCCLENKLILGGKTELKWLVFFILLSVDVNVVKKSFA